jgi:hypothetical protein
MSARFLRSGMWHATLKGDVNTATAYAIGVVFAGDDWDDFARLREVAWVDAWERHWHRSTWAARLLWSELRTLAHVDDVAGARDDRVWFAEQLTPTTGEPS